MKLFVCLKGDPSVGIWDQQFTVEVPFEKDDVEQKDLDDFRDAITKLYTEFSGDKVGCDYDFELEAEAAAEEEMYVDMAREEMEALMHTDTF